MDSHAKGSVFLLKGKPHAENPYRSLPKYIEGESFPYEGCEQWK